MTAATKLPPKNNRPSNEELLRELDVASQALPESDLRIMSEVQAITRKYVPEGYLLSDEISADRRKEDK